MKLSIRLITPTTTIRRHAKSSPFALAIMFALSIIVSSCDTPGDQYLLIDQVNVITMNDPELITNGQVLMRDGIIQELGTNIKIPKNTRVIHGQGRYLIPGFNDMHMHIDHADVLLVNLAYGVTSVMNYRGLAEHLVLKEQSLRDSVLSPFIYNTGDYMEGYPATFPGFLSFDDTTDAKNAVRAQKEAGYDFIKVYRNLDSAMHRVICRTAKEEGLIVVGHLSPDIAVEQSLRNGQKVIAHTEELMYFFNYLNDSSRIDELTELLKDYGAIYTPNLGIFRSIITQVRNIDSLNDQTYIKYLHPALFQSWRKENNYNHSRGLEFADFMEERFGFLRYVTKALWDSGIPMYTSTDAPTAGAFPGLAVHQELQEFVEIGLTPYQALTTATRLPGEFILEHTADTIPSGMIKAGYRANLVLVDENPLEDISHTQGIQMVIKNGVPYSKKYLDSRLETIAANYQQVDQQVRHIEKLISEDSIEAAHQQFFKYQAMDTSQLLVGYYTTGFAGYRYLYDNRSFTKDPEQASKAVKLYQIYAQSFPDLHGSYYFLGLAHQLKGDTLAAQKNYKRSLDLHPGNPYVKRRLNEMGVSVSELYK